jgi:hypothetical protein
MIRYLFELPERIRAGRVLVHNHVRPTDFQPHYPAGLKGFRFWTQRPQDLPPLKRCYCEWAPHVPEHYQVDRAASRKTSGEALATPPADGKRIRKRK